MLGGHHNVGRLSFYRRRSGLDRHLDGDRDSDASTSNFFAVAIFFGVSLRCGAFVG